ncbi:MAG: hypothetical protein AAFZ05_14375, partial [Pseudomonadota bacterium]
GLLCIAFFVPQALHIDRSPVGATHAAWVTWLYISLCLVLGWIGFVLGKRRGVFAGVSQLERPSDWNWTLVCSAVLFFVGVLSIFRVSTMASEGDLGTEWQGVITLWYLLIQFVFIAAAINWVAYLRTGRRAFLVLAVLSAAAILFVFNENVKRHMIAELAVIAAGGWFLCRGRQVWRPAVLAACLLGTVFLHQVGAVRDYVRSGQGNVLEAVAAGVPFRDFRFLSADRAPELTHAVVDIATTARTGTYEGFSLVWNTLVHQYVPAFLVGAENKTSLKVALAADRVPDVAREAHQWHGATRTGFSDSFRAFGIAGAIVFLALGALMGVIYGHALAGHFTAQVLYLVLLNDSLIALTEATARFVTMLPFVVAVVWFATRARARDTMPAPIAVAPQFKGVS